MYANPEEMFGGPSKLLALIELIYSAVGDPSLWPVVLDHVAEALAGVEILIWTNFDSAEAANVVSKARMDQAALEPYSQYYASVNVLSKRCDALYQDGRARFSDRAVPDVEFETTEFCNDYFHPNGMHYSIGIKVPLDDQVPAYIACMRPRGKRAFEDREGIVLETLMPHLQRALKLHLQFSQLRFEC